jgi:hypothetical protein
MGTSSAESADHRAAEEAAVPREDLVANTVQGLGSETDEGRAHQFPGPEAVARPGSGRAAPPRRDDGTAPHDSDDSAGSSVSDPTADHDDVVAHDGSPVPGPPSGEPPERPAPDSPMSEGSEDTAVPETDPAEARFAPGDR